MAALLNNLLASWVGQQPTKPGFTSGTLIGRPTPIPSIPGFNPLGKKKPIQPTPIPGVPNYGGSIGTPAQGRRTLLGGGS